MQHDHTFGVPVLIGPLILRIVLLVAVCTVTGAAMMRAFLGKPNRATAAAVTTSAAVALLFELMLATGFDLPDQVAVLIIAGTAFPLVLAFSRPPNAATATRYAEQFAPWVITIAAAGTLVEFVRGQTHTAIMLALVGLSWYTFGLPRWRPGSVAVRILGTALAGATIAGTGFATAIMTGT